MTCYIQQEENLDRYALEDATGFLILEDCEPEPFGPPRPGEIRFMDDGQIRSGRGRTGRIVPMREGEIG